MSDTAESLNFDVSAYLHELGVKARAAARVVGRAEPAGSLEEVLARVRRPGFDLDGTVLLPGSADEVGGEARSMPARVIVDEPDRVEIVTDASYPGWLVLADTDFPGWKAQVDGEPAAIEPAYFLFRAVRVPAGEHRVAFVYRPWPLRLGGLVTAISLGAALVAVAIARRRKGA